MPSFEIEDRNEYDPNTSSNGPAPNRSQRNDYDHLESQTDQEFLTNALTHSGGFKTGAYLIPYPIEGHYYYRRSFSIYVNYFRAIAQAMVTSVYDEPAHRTVTDQSGKSIKVEVWERFIDNATAGGVALHEFMRGTMTFCRGISSTFVVMDNWPKDQLPEEMFSAVEKRLFPYVYQRKAVSVYSMTKDRMGNLEEIIFREADVLVKEEGMAEPMKEKRYRMWNDQYSVVMKHEHNNAMGSAGELVEIEATKVEHGLGVIPVIECVDAIPDEPTDWFPKPRLMDVGRVCFDLYNQWSEIREFGRKCALAMLAVPTQGENGDLSLGQGNSMFFPMDSSHKPEWISPKADIVKALMDAYTMQREELYRIAQQNGVVGVRQAASGVALAYDFQAHQSVLKETIRIAESVEGRIFDLFVRYMKWENNGYVYDAGYNEELLPSDAGQEINNDTALKDWQLVPSFDAALEKDNWLKRFPKASQEETQKVFDEIDAKYSEANMKRKLELEMQDQGADE